MESTVKILHFAGILYFCRRFTIFCMKFMGGDSSKKYETNIIYHPLNMLELYANRRENRQYQVSNIFQIHTPKCLI